jgi:hypothetical protein
MDLDSTLDHYHEQAWYPNRFLRGAIGPWLDQGQPSLSDRLRSEARQRIAGQHFELEASKRREIERIYAAAEQAVSGWGRRI